MAIVDPRLPRPWQPQNTPTESDFSRLLRRLDELFRDILRRIGALEDSSGSGSSATATQVTLTVSPVATGMTEFTVIDASVTATSKLFATLVAESDAENDAEQIIDDDMKVLAIPGASSIRFLLSANGQFVGPFKVNYQVFA